MENNGEIVGQDRPFYPSELVEESSYRRPLRVGSEIVNFDVIKVPGVTRSEATEYVDRNFIITDPSRPDHDDVQEHFIESLRKHNESVQSGQSELREHQKDVFEDIAHNFEDGERTGYVKLPTGTGKTVIFVELSKALIDNAPANKKPRILVVTPTKDLVHQTVGEDIEKGFSMFAEDLKISTYFSDTKNTKESSIQDKVKDSDVCVTTYRSFSLMFEDAVESDFIFEYESPSEDTSRKQKVKRKRYFRRESEYQKVIDLFDIIIFDESHWSHGATINDKIDRLKKRDMYMIGFTATPDNGPDRQLTDVLGKEFHSMGIKEALDKELLAPVISFGISTGIRLGDDVYNRSTGQYYDEVLSNYLGFNESRNQQIVDAALALIEAGIPPVISCLPGKDLYHPRHIAKLINKSLITDPVTGLQRRPRMASVDSATSTTTRKRILGAFENEKYDGLTFINILREGWDSQTAKGLINARPTRSAIFGQQRLGRVLRLDKNGKPGVIIDLVDDIGNKKIISPVNTSDLLERDSPLEIGEVTCRTGHPDGKTLGIFSEDLRQALQNRSLTLQSLSQDFTMSQELLRQHEQSIDRKTTAKEDFIDSFIDEDGNVYSVRFATLARMNESNIVPGISNRILDTLEIKRRSDYSSTERKINFKPRKFYNVDEIIDDISRLPEVNPNKYTLLSDNSKWVTPKALEKILTKKFTWIDESTISDILDDIQTNNELDHDPLLVKFKERTKADGSVIYGVSQLYKLETYKLVAKYLMQQ